jgi:UDPglucose--hexose-1-phosphate uridylyltransferase
MIDNLDKIDTISDRDVFRRQFTKRDGRELFLYGYNAHSLPPLPEDDFDVAKGGELRWHPLRNEWNVYAAHRQNRTFKPSAAEDPLAPSTPGGPKTEIPFTDFELAIFENKFTSLHPEAPLPTAPNGVEAERAQGRCDVVVYTPEQTGSLHTIGQDKRRLLITAWIDRYKALFNDGHKFVLPFESRGDEVGVTLHHPHGQIYAFPFIPRVQQDAVTSFNNGYDLSAAIKNYKTDYGVASAGDMEAFCPPFARFPFEVWIAPQSRKPGPWAFSETEIDGFATLLGDITRRYDEYFQRPTAYMLSLHAAPLGAEDSFHFTAQFYPILRAPGRVKFLASVEQSTGTFTVDVMPEMAAQTLRVL